MEQQQQLIVVFYNPSTRQVLGRGGRFASLQEFADYPPTRQEDVLPPGDSKSDPPGIAPLTGGTIKCIDNLLHFCINTRCYCLDCPPGIPC
jgi:hypothetical protein